MFELNNFLLCVLSSSLSMHGILFSETHLVAFRALNTIYTAHALKQTCPTENKLILSAEMEK